MAQRKPVRDVSALRQFGKGYDPDRARDILKGARYRSRMRPPGAVVILQDDHIAVGEPFVQLARPGLSDSPARVGGGDKSQCRYRVRILFAFTDEDRIIIARREQLRQPVRNLRYWRFS
jgi:hypothetical protein